MTNNETQRGEVHVAWVLLAENVLGKNAERQYDGVSVSTEERVYG